LNPDPFFAATHGGECMVTAAHEVVYSIGLQHGASSKLVFEGPWRKSGIFLQ